MLNPSDIRVGDSERLPVSDTRLSSIRLSSAVVVITKKHNLIVTTTTTSTSSKFDEKQQ